MVDKNSFGDNFVRFFGNIRIKLVNFWKRVWGEDIPDFDYSTASEDEFERADELKKHIRKKDFLKAKRIFIICILVILLNFIICFFCNHFMNYIKTNKFFARMNNKPVCIYSGPKRTKSSIFVTTTKLNNGDIYIYNNDCDSKCFYLSRLDDLYPIENPFWANVLKPFSIVLSSFDDIIKGLYNYYDKHYSYYSAEVYRKNKNKFVKVKNYRSDYDRNGGILFVDTENNVYNFSNPSFIWKREEKMDKYVFKKNEFESIENPIKFTALKSYAKYKDKYLVVEVFNTLPSKFNIECAVGRPFLLNPDTMEAESFADFAQQPRKGVEPYGIKVLKNGKMIIPFKKLRRYDDGRNIEEYVDIDHIEIYDPVQNRFFAENNPDILLDNYFQIELKNNDVMFINKNSTWIFDNETNSFREADEILKLSNKDFVNYTNQVLNRELGLSLEDEVTQKLKYISLAPNQYLLTCGAKSNASDERCKHTVFVDYNNHPAQKGPDFIYGHNYSKIEKIDDKRVMVIGGTSFDDDKNSIPHKRVQIIEVK